MKPQHDIQELRARVSVIDAWRWLGLPNPPAAPGLCKSPFREDRKPSFSICHGGSGYKDHATGETGDVVGFIARAKSCSVAEAVRFLAEMAGVPQPQQRQNYVKSDRPPHRWPQELRKPTMAELFQLRDLRGLPCIAGMEILINRGVMHAGMAHDAGEDVPAWILQDARQQHARRMDGKPWAWLGAKSWTRAGSDLTLPLGIDDLHSRSAVIIIEGGPDLIAAASFAFMELGEDMRKVGFIASMSASQKPSPIAASMIRQKPVRLVPHVDENSAGRNWARLWVTALQEAGSRVDVFRLEPLNVKDLCELAPRYTLEWCPVDDEDDNHQLPEELHVFRNLIP